VSERASDYVRRLPIGERLPISEVINDDLFPFEGDILVRPLTEPILPEPPRNGEAGGGECHACRGTAEGLIWEDERWWAFMAEEPSGLPAIAVLMPKTHEDLEGLPPDVVGELGGMIQRLARAIGRLDSVGRVHVNRWGDGSEHFHVWFLARPRGMWQLRGAMLAVWDDLLPRVPVEEWLANRRTIAAALAEEGGQALV
jgi:diadenosine tetraphosphate (Ap4A) HIT family hydrolase